MIFQKDTLIKTLLLTVLSISTSFLFAQDDNNTVNEVFENLTTEEAEAFWEHFDDSPTLSLGSSAVLIASILDPANHQCCTPEPPAEVDIEIDGNTLTVSTVEPDHWFNFSASCDQSTNSCSGETSITLAGFEDVRNTFSCGVHAEGLQCDVVLGADGELFDETLEYTLQIDAGNTFQNIIDGNPITQSVPIPAEPVPEAAKVKTLGGSRNATFGLGAYSDNGTPAYGNSFSSGDFITIYGEITPDPVDVGTNGELFAAILSVVGGKASFSSIDMDGNFVVWDLSVEGLEPLQQAMPLQSSHQIKVFEGNLQAGVHKVTFAYMADEGPIVYMKPITIQVSD